MATVEQKKANACTPPTSLAISAIDSRKSDKKPGNRMSPRLLNTPSPTRDGGKTRTVTTPKPLPNSASPKLPVNSVAMAKVNKINLKQRSRSESEAELNIVKKEEKSKPITKKDACPCKASRSGADWLIKCSTCQQMWHTTCSNLPGIQSGDVVNVLTASGWNCPWCAHSAYPRPKNHVSSKREQSLFAATTTSKICEGVTENMNESIEKIVTKSINDIEERINKKLLILTQSPPASLQNIENQLQELTCSIESFRENASHHPPGPVERPRPSPPPQIDSMAPPSLATVTHEPVHSVKDNYIADDSANDILRYLGTVKFRKEGQRETVTYGKKYKYLGSKNIDPEPMPDVLKPIITKLNDEITGDYKYKINQCLINKYTNGSSSLPQHSDDEASIDPNSSIFTISIGADRSIVFIKKSDKSKTVHIAKDRSLYEMTRSSQNHFTHGIDAEDQPGVRYSLTFRRVHWTNFNSTLLYGASNFGPIQMGKGRGTIGKSTPGLKQFAAKVEDINPTTCESYQNIVCMFGTNNLKDRKMTEEGVLETYKLYKGKLEQVRQTNPKCKLLVCPVLPTRSDSINKMIVCFNNYLFTDLRNSKLDIHIVWGFGEFVDYQGGLLKSSLCGPHWEGDPLHLNPSGTRLLVRLIKQNIFSLRRPKAPGARVDGRSYQAVLDGPPAGRGGRAGGWVSQSQRQVPRHARGHS